MYAHECACVCMCVHSCARVYVRLHVLLFSEVNCKLREGKGVLFDFLHSLALGADSTHNMLYVC